jgi:hypothetical protein
MFLASHLSTSPEMLKNFTTLPNNNKGYPSLGVAFVVCLLLCQRYSLVNFKFVGIPFTVSLSI